jgi:hypothetical protein
MGRFQRYIFTEHSAEAVHRFEYGEDHMEGLGPGVYPEFISKVRRKLGKLSEWRLEVGHLATYVRGRAAGGIPRDSASVAGQ